MADRSASRVINQKAIIDKIYQNNGISKAQLAKELGISKPAVSDNVANLISIGMVQEKGEGKAAKAGGRKPVMLYFNETHRYVGALDLSFQEPVCAVCDLKYHIMGLKEISVSKSASPDERRKCIGQAFLDIFKERGLSLEKLGMVIISHPGIIEEEVDEHYSEKRHHAWTEIGLKQYLQQELNVPVSIKNDVNLAAMGEVHFGLDKRTQDLVYVTCGVGLGAGIVINGELYEGTKRAAGEIGASLLSDGRRAEDAVAMDGFIRRVEQFYAESGVPKAFTFDRIAALAKKDDVLVGKAIYETGRELGRLIFNCCVVLDIPTVVFGGEYLKLGKKLFQGIEDVLQTTSVYRPEVIPSMLTPMAGLYGGFVLGTDKIIQSFL